MKLNTSQRVTLFEVARGFRTSSVGQMRDALDIIGKLEVDRSDDQDPEAYDIDLSDSDQKLLSVMLSDALKRRMFVTSPATLELLQMFGVD